MKLSARLFISLTCLALALAACSLFTFWRGNQQVIDTVWQALEPNTSSHDRAAWEVDDVRLVTGQEVQFLFEGKTGGGWSCPGPRPPDDETIVPDGSYWFVQMSPGPAAAEPWPTEQYSPTAPSLIPEPFVKEARFLVDASTGQVVARKLSCIIH